MPANTILILGADPAAAAALATPLVTAGHGVTLVDAADDAVAQASAHRILIIDRLEPGRDAAQVCRLIRSVPDLRNLAVCVISPLDDVESRVRLLEAGADEVLIAPVDARELEARIEALLVRFQRSTYAGQGSTIVEAPARRRRRSIAVFSSSGGVGTTTIAVNVAVTLAGRFHEGAAIIDLSWPFGQVATHLDLTTRQTLGQLGRDESALRDPALMRAYATRHATGLNVLAAPGAWEPFGVLGGDGTQLLVDTAMLAYDVVVVDAGSSTDERTVAALQRCDAIVLAVRPEIAALRALHSLADSLTLNGIELDRAIFVLNHLFAREDLKARDIEMALGRPPAVELPYDPGVYVKAVNEGVPVVRGAPATPAAEALTRLAAIAIGDGPSEDAPGIVAEPPVPAERRSPGLLGGIFGKRG